MAACLVASSHQFIELLDPFQLLPAQARTHTTGTLRTIPQWVLEAKEMLHCAKFSTRSWWVRAVLTGQR